MIVEKLSYTIPEAIAATGRSRTDLYRAFSEGKLPARKSGRRTVILADDLKRWLEALPAATFKAPQAA